MDTLKRPSKQDLEAARKKTVADVIGKNLKVLFVGINPGLYTAAIGHHFGRPGNRFWPALYAGGFTNRLLSPYEERELLKDGYGITNVAPRATATADDLSLGEIQRGGKALSEKIKKYEPGMAAILGIRTYRAAFHFPKAKIGLQKERIGSTQVWVLPNPSGLNAHYQPRDLARLFKQLHDHKDY